MNEFTECIKMIDKQIKDSAFAMFTGINMTPADYRILKAWVVTVEERLKATNEKDELIADLQSRLNAMTSKHALQVDAADDLRQRVAALELDYERRQAGK